MGLPACGASYASHEILHKNFRVRVLSATHVAVDELLFFGPPEANAPRIGWTGPSLRPRLSVLLEGEAEIRSHGKLHALAPGDVFFNRQLRDLGKRMAGPRATLLAIDWDLGSLGTREMGDAVQGRLSEAELCALRRAAEAFSSPGQTGADHAATLADVVSRLRSFGVPFDPPDPRSWGDAPPPRAGQILAAIDMALSNLHGEPMAVDLEGAVGVSRWQIQRQLEPVALHYALNGGTWRTMRRRWRLGVAFFLATALGATTEAVARAVGFGSPQALCRAFSDASLPSPGEVRRLAWRG